MPGGGTDPTMSVTTVVDALLAIIAQMELGLTKYSDTMKIIEKIQNMSATLAGLVTMIQTGKGADGKDVDWQQVATQLKAVTQDLAALQVQINADPTMKATLGPDYAKFITQLNAFANAPEKPVEWAQWYDGSRDDLALLATLFSDPMAFARDPSGFLKALDRLQSNIAAQEKLAPDKRAAWFDSAKFFINQVLSVRIEIAPMDVPYSDPPKTSICTLGEVITAPYRQFSDAILAPDGTVLRPPAPTSSDPRTAALQRFAWYFDKNQAAGSKLTFRIDATHLKTVERPDTAYVNSMARVGVNALALSPPAETWMAWAGDAMLLYTQISGLLNEPINPGNVGSLAGRLSALLDKLRGVIGNAGSIAIRPAWWDAVVQPFADLLGMTVSAQPAGDYSWIKKDPYGYITVSLLDVIRDPGKADQLAYSIEGGAQSSHWGRGGLEGYLLTFAANKATAPKDRRPFDNVTQSLVALGTDRAKAQTQLETSGGGLAMKLKQINWISQDPSNRSSALPKVWADWTDVVGLDPRKTTGSFSEMLSWVTSINQQLQEKTSSVTKQMMMVVHAGRTLMEGERAMNEQIKRRFEEMAG